MMSFSLSNTPSTFMMMMSEELRPFIVSFLVHFDDILIYSHGKKGHVAHLRQVMGVILRVRFYINIKKCYLCKHAFIVYIVTAKGLKANS